MYQTGDGPGFHTKGYIFRQDGLYRILIGRANMTQYALTVNQEWNTKIVSTEQGEFAGKVLFIVHRKTILRQALESYRRVFGSGKKMALLTGEDQDYQAIGQADFVFAMITMISRDDVLGRFHPYDYQIAVLDEVHHAAAASYQKVMNYFKPDFWLGMTATPDQTDTGNIYELFDHNIAYEIRLQQALSNARALRK